MLEHVSKKRAKPHSREHLDGTLMGNDMLSADDSLAIRGLADLEDDLLTQIATHRVEAPSRRRYPDVPSSHLARWCCSGWRLDSGTATHRLLRAPTLPLSAGLPQNLRCLFYSVETSAFAVSRAAEAAQAAASWAHWRCMLPFGLFSPPLWRDAQRQQRPSVRRPAASWPRHGGRRAPRPIRAGC